MLLSLKGIPFEDVRITYAEWPAIKPSKTKLKLESLRAKRIHFNLIYSNQMGNITDS